MAEEKTQCVDIVSLINKRRFLKGRVTHISNLVNNAADDELPFHSARLREILSKIEEVNMNIELIDPKEQDAGLQLESRCTEILIALQRRQEAARTHSHDARSGMLGVAASHTKLSSGAALLPKIALPTFNGNYDEWLSFKDLFNSLVNNNAELDDVNKFYYLKSCLKGEAASLVSTIDHTAANYCKAWDVLMERYDNRVLIANHHIQTLFNLSKVNRTYALRNLLNDFKQHFNSLLSLQVPNLDDMLLIHILSSKLDYGTLRDFELNRKSLEFPTLDDFIKHIQQRCQALEIISSDYTAKPASQRSVSNVITNKEGEKDRKMGKCGFCQGKHFINRCFKFLKLTVGDRKKFVDKLNLCVLCLSSGHSVANCKQTFLCRLCQQKHHTLLHVDTVPASTNNLIVSNRNIEAEQLANHMAVPTPATDCLHLVDSVPVVPQQTLNLYTATEEKLELSLLPTALCYIIDNSGEVHSCRILFDSGSQKNYITEEFVSKLDCVKTSVKFTVSGVGGNATPVSSKINLQISSRDFTHKFKSDFCVLKKITECLPNTNFSKKLIRWPGSVNLADPNFNVSRKVDAILGINDFCLCLRDGQVDLGTDLPGLLNTTFGWIFCGNLVLTRAQLVKMPETSVCQFLQEDLTKFWTMEELPSQHVMSNSDAVCEQLYVESVSRDSTGRYEVDLPVKRDMLPKLGNSFNMALRCLLSLEKKFQSNQDLFNKYSDFVHEFVKLGHGHWVDDFPNSSQPEFYMPHLAVVRADAITTQLRVVFNASARSSTGLSLNDILYTGPVVQANLFEILLRFRLNKYAFICDMQKMYRQVNIKNYQSLQRILWRELEGELKCLQLSTVTYGTAPASYLATRTLLKLVEDEGTNFPLASKVVLENTYCDDILAGSDSVDTTVQIMSELQNLLGKGKFDLHKWYSNSQDVLRHIPQDKHTKCTFKFDTSQDAAVKTLGLKWNPENDRLSVSCPNEFSNTKSTKRQVLADIAKIFDPQGFVAPVTVFAKIIMQSIWKEKVNWDDDLPDHILKVWRLFCYKLPILNSISVPRLMVDPERCTLEIHGFADASTKAFGCVVYARCILPNNKYTVHFICAKSRVAPIKTVTLARLELCAAHMLAQLINNVAKILSVQMSNVFCWSDAMITLSWIKADPSRWQVFVANRVSQIQDLTFKTNWNYVKTDENPADAVSRGSMPQDLVDNDLWFQGPQWLIEGRECWSKQPLFSAHETKCEEKSTHVALTVAQEVPISYLPSIFQRFSKWWRLVRTFSYVFRFINNIRYRNKKLCGPLTVKELNNASSKIVMYVQKEYFHKEFKMLSATVDSDHCSFTVNQIKYLNIFIDENGCLRVGGRLKHSSLPRDHKNPLLLPPNHHVTDLIMLQEHERLLHAGIETTLSSLRSRFWPLNARNRLRKLIHSCTKCFRFHGHTMSQVMADLPKYRVTPARPFLLSGVDFAGPLEVKEWRTRNPIIHKGYVCIFICLSTKAIDLQLVSDLSTKEFINALKRFISRRGKCLQMFSDNGTNFQGANNELKAAYNLFKNNMNNLSDFANTEGFEWHFIPPSSPHWGGIWESGVKMVKHHLKRVLGNNILTYEHLNTLLIEIEAILNSRPISPLSEDTADEQCLTPAHFIIGDRLTSFPEADKLNIPDNRLKIYDLITKMKQSFWKRWRMDYLNSLQMRYKWHANKPNITLNSLVLLKEDNVPTLSWPMGRVVKLFYGKDNNVRAVSVKTKNSVYVRPITKIIPFPV